MTENYNGCGKKIKRNDAEKMNYQNEGRRRNKKKTHLHMCSRMDVNRIKRLLGLNEESEVVHLFHTTLERAGDKISKQRPGSFPEDKMPGTANFLLVTVDPQVDELSDEVQPKLVGVPVGTMLLDR